MSIEKDEDYNKTEDGITLKVKPKLDTISSNTYYTVYKTLMFLSNLLFYKTLGNELIVHFMNKKTQVQRGKVLSQGCRATEWYYRMCLTPVPIIY